MREFTEVSLCDNLPSNVYHAVIVYNIDQHSIIFIQSIIYTTVNGKRSETIILGDNGVPQGSVVSPIFLNFKNVMDSVIRNVYVLFVVHTSGFGTNSDIVVKITVSGVVKCKYFPVVFT